MDQWTSSARGGELGKIFKSILVAVAGYTDPATGKTDDVLETVMERNIRYACDLAKATGSKLTLIHVAAIPPVADPSVLLDPRPFQEAGRSILENAKKIAKDNGVDAETILETSYGNPAQTIIQAAEKGGFDMITISSRGHSLLRNLLLGSVCDAVTRNAPCAVLVVR
jgi:nucleotide-binding universal stress UspA family protein